MDVVLELTDTFLADYVYAWAHPASPAPYDYPNLQPNTTAPQAFSSWQYKPASSMIYVEPSEYAYMSAWPRDNMYRQGLSLFMITW